MYKVRVHLISNGILAYQNDFASKSDAMATVGRLHACRSAEQTLADYKFSTSENPVGRKPS